MAKNDKKSTDLAKFDKLTQAQNDGVDVDIVGPDGADLGIKIKVAGPDSDRRREVEEKQINDRLARQYAVDPTAADIELTAVKILAGITLGWTGIELDGAEYRFSEDNARAIYQRFPWLREQVDKAAGSRKRFLTALKDASAEASSASSES